MAWACSSDSPGGDPADGGTAADGATIVPSDGGGGGAACASLPAKEELADLGTNATTRFGLGEGGLVALDRKLGADTGNPILPKTGALLLVPKAGGAPTPFYTPTPPRILASYVVAGNDVLIMDYDAASSGRSGQLYKKSFGEAAATPIGTPKYDGLASYIAAADASNVYVVTPGAAGNFKVVRVDRATGAETSMADLPSTQFAQAQLQGGFVWFYAAQGTGALYKSPVAGGEAVRVTDRGCFGGGLLVAEGAFFCGGSLRLEKLDAAFANPILILDALEEKDASAPRPQAVFGSEVLVTLAIEAKRRTKIYAAPTIGGAKRAIACDVGNIADAYVDGDYAYFLDEKSSANEPSVKKLWRVRHAR